MFSLPAIWQDKADQRNAERFRQIDDRMTRLVSILDNSINKVNVQRAGYKETFMEVKTFGRGEVSSLAQHGGWFAQEEMGRDLTRIQEILTEIAVLSAGFEVVAESQS